MRFLEKNLEDIIFETPNHLLNARGLHIHGVKKRQVHIGNYGVADLIVFDKGYLDVSEGELKHENSSITIYELKQGEINIDTLLQAIRYAKGIERYFMKYRHIEYDIKITLIGNSISKNSPFLYMADIMSKFLDFYTYTYDFDGIRFKRIYNYRLIEEGF